MGLQWLFRINCLGGGVGGQERCGKIVFRESVPVFFFQAIRSQIRKQLSELVYCTVNACTCNTSGLDSADTENKHNMMVGPLFS